MAPESTPDAPEPRDDRAVHGWFSLSYANYLTIPRSVLQAMPGEWQGRFVGLMEELDAAIDWRPGEGCYWVSLKDGKGRYVRDPLADYRHGREDAESRRIERIEGRMGLRGVEMGPEDVAAFRAMLDAARKEAP